MSEEIASYLIGERRIRANGITIHRYMKIRFDGTIVYVDKELMKIGHIGTLALSPQRIYPCTKEQFDLEFEIVMNKLKGLEN
jgi:hypothetical protein